MRHVYLFSFSHNAGYGHMDFVLTKPLQPEHLPEIVKAIQKQFRASSVVITNIYKFEQPPPAPESALPDASERAVQRGLGQ